ncbi:Bardet-Biedl syndrome 10 protein homolog [Strongylocentrotus purpuratus]|uniref:Uncharacterized protein n=1 Tax=Strongylocentrotus purpuratus TaxID=7668 RepID=A0A7M7N7U5_STRPU|nr:Bardet-Biedl syndrome 10 protein homolog [Strongylocentrotus purpuratus]
MANQVPVNIQSSLAICTSLASLVQKSYGANAQLVMYTTSTGKVLLTSDGSSILGALHVSHPIGRWLIDRIVTFGHHTGDHTKSFLLLARNILDEISHELSSSVNGLSLRCETVQREQVIQLVKALRVVVQEILPQKILPALMAKSQCFSALDLKAINTFGENLIHTYLHGRISFKQASFMSKLLWKFINGYAGSSEASVSSLRGAAIALQDNFCVASIEAVGLPIESSDIKEGIVLSRCFAKHLNERKGGEERRIIIFGFDPSKMTLESNATISARTVEALVHSMQHTRLQMMRIVNLLQDKNVSVVLFSECVSAAFLSLLDHASITVIQAVPIEELQRLSHVAGINILYEIPRELDASCTVMAEEVKEVTLGKHRYSHIIIRSGPGEGHLVLCAPSEAMCRVLSQAALGAIRCVKVWLDADDGTISRSVGSECIGSKDQSKNAPLKVEPSEISCMKHEQSKPSKLHLSQSVCNANIAGCGKETEVQTGYLISGGGAAEFIARNVLTQSLPAYKDDYFQYATINIICNALLCIPRTIYHNSFAAQSKDNRSFIKIIYDVQRRCESQTSEAWGIDGKTGEACYMFNRGVVEVLTGKYLLWCNVIETLIELLNMDIIIPVQRILKDAESEDEDDD